MRLLSPHFRPPVAPTSARFGPEDVIGSAWRHIVGAEHERQLVAGRRRIVPAFAAVLKQEAPASTEVDAKAEILLFLHDPSDGAATRLIDGVQAEALQHAAALKRKHPQLPPDRWAAISEDARGVGLVVRRVLDESRERLDAEQRLWGEPRLLRVMAEELRRVRLSPLTVSRSDSTTAKLAGQQQEAVAVRWARDAYPRSEVLQNCLIVGAAPAGLKAELDALVVRPFAPATEPQTTTTLTSRSDARSDEAVQRLAPRWKATRELRGEGEGEGEGEGRRSFGDEDAGGSSSVDADDSGVGLRGTIEVIVEAKAGPSSLMGDLPKLLAARECLQRSAAGVVEMRIGKGGETVRLAIDGASPPRLAYVLGRCTDLDECVCAAVHHSGKGALLDKRMGSASPADEWLHCVGDDASVLVASFCAADVAKFQVHVDAFAETLRGLLESGELECWASD